MGLRCSQPHSTLIASKVLAHDGVARGDPGGKSRRDQPADQRGQAVVLALLAEHCPAGDSLVHDMCLVYYIPNKKKHSSLYDFIKKLP